jgi:hypothetical protein
MRKIYYLLLCLFILTGCSKNSTVSPTTTSTKATVTYTFTANVSGKYIVNFIVPTSLADSTVYFTGSIWSRSYSVANATSYINGKVLPLYMGSAAELAGQILTLKIGVNNKTEVSNSSTSTEPNVTAAYNYQFTN